MASEILYEIITVIAGAIGGLIRTYHSHDSQLVFPTVNIKDRIFRLGFVASVIVGAVISYLSAFGFITFLPAFSPSSVWEAIFFGLIMGLLSLDILNRLLGMRLEDVDTLDLDPSCPIEQNKIKKEMYEKILKEIPEIERIHIRDGDVAGVMITTVVPEVDADENRVLAQTENILQNMKHPGIQSYVYLPEEKMIDIQLLVEIMNGDSEKKKERYIENIKNTVREYVNGLKPGESVKQSQIIGKVVRISPLIRDVRGDRISSDPEFKEGRIPIGRYEVARCGEVTIDLIIRSLSHK